MASGVLLKKRATQTNTYIPSQNVVEARLQLDVILVDVVIEILCPQNLGYPHQLEREREDELLHKNKNR